MIGRDEKLKTKSKILVSVIVLLLVAGGIYGYRQFSGNEDQSTTVKMSAQMSMEVQTGTLRQTVSASGNIQPVQEKDLKVQTGDYVEKIHVEIGDRVKVGDVLIELNDREERLSYLKAKNQYKAIQINGSPSEIEEAKIDLEIAEEKLADKTIIAPFDGMIVDLVVEEGDFANQVIAQIIDDTSYQVEVDVDESEARYLEIGQQATVTMEALPSEQITGQVIEIGQSADVNSGVVTFPVTIMLDQRHPEMKSGYSADLEITVGLAENQVVIPITAIISKNGREIVMKDVDGKATPVPVQTGLSDGLQIAVVSGLEVGDKIMINTGSFASQTTQAFPNQQQGTMMMPRVPGAGFKRGGK